MALNRLTSAEMMNLSATMVDAGHADYLALINQPALAGLVPGMADAHNMLLSASQGSLQMLLAPLSDAQTEVDHRHDWLARAVRGGFDLYIALARAHGDHELVGKLARLKDAMFPNGLHIVNASYREEAGHAQVLRTLLTADVEATLGSLSVRGGSLLDLVREWIAAGDQLGELENQRVALLTQGRNGDMFRARSRWSKMISLLRAIIATMELSDPVVLQLMDRIARAEQVADRRSQGDKDEPSATGDGPTSDGPTGDGPTGDGPTGDGPDDDGTDGDGQQAAGDGSPSEPGDEFGDGSPDDLLAEAPEDVAPDGPVDLSAGVQVQVPGAGADRRVNFPTRMDSDAPDGVVAWRHCHERAHHPDRA